MLKLEKLNIDEEYDQFNCLIEYPVIKNLNDNLFINYINKKIYNDVLIFKELLMDDSFKSDNTFGFADFKIHFNKNNIVSISIIFSQLYDSNKIINYVNTYNYDIKRKKEILIDDIFCKKDFIHDYSDYNFYITDNFISIVFSSFENNDSFFVDEFKIYYDKYIDSLSNYAKHCIMG